jgi:hypothetical protein
MLVLWRMATSHGDGQPSLTVTAVAYATTSSTPSGRIAVVSP